jgi:hypothetical protein
VRRDEDTRSAEPASNPAATSGGREARLVVVRPGGSSTPSKARTKGRRCSVSSSAFIPQYSSSPCSGELAGIYRYIEVFDVCTSRMRQCGERLGLGGGLM